MDARQPRRARRDRGLPLTGAGRSAPRRREPRAQPRRHHHDRRSAVEMQTIGFIGLGKMGGNMAARYLAAGYTVYGEARNRDGAQWLIDQGLKWVDTPREVAQAADVVMTSLPNDDVVESIATGTDGLLAGLSDRKIWADLSTITPGVSRNLAARVHDDGHGAL